MGQGSTLYMPEVATKWANISGGPDLLEEFKVWIPLGLIRTTPCSITLRIYEWRLHLAAAHNALVSLRQSLHCRSVMYKYKDVNLRG